MGNPVQSAAWIPIYPWSVSVSSNVIMDIVPWRYPPTSLHRSSDVHDSGSTVSASCPAPEGVMVGDWPEDVLGCIGSHKQQLVRIPTTVRVYQCARDGMCSLRRSLLPLAFLPHSPAPSAEDRRERTLPHRKTTANGPGLPYNHQRQQRFPIASVI